MRSIVEIGGNVPAFLGKLWKLVNDSATYNLISWSPGGNTFLIKNQAEFARELLPLYYKHSNMASFIRQLNMYGFHKVTSVDNGGLKCDKDEIEFTHPYFIKGHAYLLENIKRKIANPKSFMASADGDKIMLKPELMNKVLLNVKQMKGKQESMDARFSVMKTENEALWREVALLRQKHMKQQQIVNNLIQFLMSLVQPPRSSNVNSGVGVKRRYQLMINNAAHNNVKADGSSAKNPRLSADFEEDEGNHEEQNEENMDDGPTIHELAHDDLLMGEAPAEQEMDVPNATYLSIEVPALDSTGAILSPNSNSVAAQYHVTMVDGDETNLDDATIGALGSNGSMLSPSALSPLINSPPSVASEPINQSSVSPTPNILVNSAVNMPSKSKAQRHNAGKLNVTRNDTNIFNVKSSPINLNMPADIFGGDDIISEPGVSLSDVNKQAEISSACQSSPLTYVTQSPLCKDQLLNSQTLNVDLQKSITQGSFNAKALANSDKNKHNSKKNRTNKKAVKEQQPMIIKTESMDESDWPNMTLATVDNNLDLGKFSSMRDYIMNGTDDKVSRKAGYKNKGDLDDHLDTMQSDLDSLRELLRGDNYSLDTNTLYGNTNTEDGSVNRPSFPDPRLHFNYEGGLKLFGQDDLLFGLSMNNMEDKSNKTNSNADPDNQMISYTTPLLDFDEFSLSNVNGENSQSALSSTLPDDSSSTLNTPQIGFTESPFNP